MSTKASPEFREWFNYVSAPIIKALQLALADGITPDDKMLLFDRANQMSIGDVDLRADAETVFELHKFLSAMTERFNGVVSIGVCDCAKCGGTVVLIGMRGEETLLAKGALDHTGEYPQVGVLEITDPVDDQNDRPTIH